jgi:predicted transcriptional regulator of viral defense system
VSRYPPSNRPGFSALRDDTALTSNVYLSDTLEVMNPQSVAQRIADIAAGQWGMITTAQARVHGVARANLAHRVRTGELERTEHYGVYRLASAASSPLDDLRAAWMSTKPELLAMERTATPRPDAILASAAAAHVHGMSDVYPAPYRVIASGRRQSAKGAVSYSWRPLDVCDIELIDGLPVTTRERTIVDLLVDEGDVSIAADALRDAKHSGYVLDEARLEELLIPHAKRLGQTAGDGVGAHAYLMVAAEMDAVSEAVRALDRLLRSKVPLPGIERFVDKVITDLPALAAKVPATISLAHHCSGSDPGGHHREPAGGK